MELSGKKVLLVGLARSGEALAVFCKARGADVTVTDIASEEALGDRVRRMRELSVTLTLGPHREEVFTSADLIVVSPGVPHTLAVLDAARKKGIPVIGEVELASRFITAPLVAVSGTNGKSTVVTLLGVIFQNAGLRVFTGGNLGNPLINAAAEDGSYDVVVAEISSFQLDTIEAFRPKVAVLLNVTEDHLDRYPDMDAYAESKARLFENQEASDFAVLNGNDSYCRGMRGGIAAKKLYFTGRQGLPGADIMPGEINVDLGSEKFSLSLEKMKLVGTHNMENVAASAIAARLAGAPVAAIQKSVDEFAGLSHRIEFVRERNGVSYYDDSKATNVDAVVRALEGFPRPVIVIMGGRDKESDFGILVPMVRKHAALVVVTGEAAEKIAGSLSDHVEIERAKTMKDAVVLAASRALPGWSVLLSPGCASFDAYRNYAERGDDFKNAVMAL
ncbi:MAG: UDP-N-acetylmuramoyl-L-alanine--D-glutamate ligase [Thermodesulfobacteriota bacterium]